MAAVVQNSSNFVATASVTTGTVTLPTGWQANDVLYIFAQLTAALGTITTPSGYATVVTSFPASASTSASQAVFRKVLTSSESDPAVTCTSGRLVCIGVLTRGADTTTPEDATATHDDNTGITLPNVQAPSITTVTDNCLLLTAHGARLTTNGATATFVIDASMDAEVDDQSTAVAASTNAAIEVERKALGAAGATGVKNATITVSAGVAVGTNGSTVAVRPAAAGAGTIPQAHLPFMR